MSILDDDRAVELVGGVKAARSAAHELVDGQLEPVRQRLHTTAKTRKSALTRKRIMDAASELMMERGDTGFQMGEVSDRCHMSKGSLYYYFSDKDELISAVFAESVDELVDTIDELAAQAPSAREALFSLYAEFARRLGTGTPLALAMTHRHSGSADVSVPIMTSNLSRAAKTIAEQMERAKAEGVIREDVDCEAAAVFAVGGLVATSMAMASGLASEGPDTVSQALMDLLVHGMGTDGV